MSILIQIVFLMFLGATGFFVYKRVIFIKNAINVGKSIDRTDNKKDRLKRTLLIAFGQKKMFKRPVVGLMHFAVYAGFLIINIEVLEIVLDGILGTHRVLAPIVGHTFYGFLIHFFEILAFLVLAFCVVFLIRRNILKLPRFWKPEMTKWPKSDANLILIFEVLLMSAFLSMDAMDSILQDRNVAHYHHVGTFAVSQFLIPLFQGIGSGTLVFLERFLWWFHILGIFGFAIYVTYSKHLHIVLAFPNTFFSNLQPKGEMRNMDNITAEVKIALGLMDEKDAPEMDENANFGAQDIKDLNWKQLMDAFTCTECGRCTSQCPANQTGKQLSPRAIMMKTRDRAEEVAKLMEKGKTQEEALDNGRTLFGDFITKEEVMACTSCNACVEACPVMIDPLSIILDVRRFITMDQADTPASWNMMFGNLETSMSPWKFSPNDRFKWSDDLNK